MKILSSMTLKKQFTSNLEIGLRNLEKNVPDFSVFINALKNLLSSTDQPTESERQGLSEFFTNNRIIVLWIIQKQEKNIHNEIINLLNKHDLSDWLVKFKSIDFEEDGKKFIDMIVKLFKEDPYERLYNIFTALIRWKSNLLNDYLTIKLDKEINVENLSLVHAELNFAEGELAFAKYMFNFYMAIAVYLEIELKSTRYCLAMAEIFEELAKNLQNSAGDKSAILNVLTAMQMSASEKQKIAKLSNGYPKDNQIFIQKFVFFIFKQMKLDKEVLEILLDLSGFSNSLFLKSQQLMPILRNLSDKITAFLKNIASIVEPNPELLEWILLITQARKGIIKNISTIVEKEHTLVKKLMFLTKENCCLLKDKVEECSKTYRLLFQQTLQKEASLKQTELLSATLSKTFADGDNSEKNNSENEELKPQPP